MIHGKHRWIAIDDKHDWITMHDKHHLQCLTLLLTMEILNIITARLK